MGGAWSNGFQSVDKRLLGSRGWRTDFQNMDKKAMGGAWSKGFQSLVKRPMGGSWSNGFQSLKKRPMGGVWPNGFQSRSVWEFGKRDANNENAFTAFSDMDDDDMMDNMRKKSDLGYLTQRLGKRSDLDFLHQRMGKRILQRFGKRTDSSGEDFQFGPENYFNNERKRMSELYRLIKRAPFRNMKRMLDPWHWYVNEKRNLGPEILWGRVLRPMNPEMFQKRVPKVPALFSQYVLRN